jgi:hypothetical protein
VGSDGMKVYLSGPISLGGTLSPEECAANLEAFDAAEEVVRALGHEPVNPAALERDGKRVATGGPNEWVQFVREDIKLLMGCDAIWSLPDWKLSKGARLEHHIADELSMPVMGS